MRKQQLNFELTEQQSVLHKPKINHNVSNQSSKVPVEVRLLSKQKEYQQKRKQKEIERQSEKVKDCTFTPNLNKPKKGYDIELAAKSEEGDLLPVDFPYDKFIDQQTSKKLKDDRTELASKVTKGYGLQLDLEKIGIFNAPIVKSEQNRYKIPTENEKEVEKLDYSEPITQHYPSEPQIVETDNIVEYGDYSSKERFSVDHEEEKYISIEPSQNVLDNEQSGSDNNEDFKENSSKFENSPIRSEQDEEAEGEGEGEGERFPILFLDVNLGKDRVERLVIYEGDDPFAVADQFCADNCLEEKKKRKLAKVIKKQLDTLLTRIDEDEDEEDSK